MLRWQWLAPDVGFESASVLNSCGENTQTHRCVTMHASAHARTVVRRINSSVFARVPVVRTLYFERIMLRPPFLLQPAALHLLAAPASACHAAAPSCCARQRLPTDVGFSEEAATIWRAGRRCFCNDAALCTALILFS